MKIGIRGHDVCGKGSISGLHEGLVNAGIDTLQLVSYKSLSNIDYVPGSINKETALELGKELKERNLSVALIGAYFNPVHSNQEKVKNGIEIFKEYLKFSSEIGCNIVGSETGSYNDDQWTYNPLNRTDEARNIVVKTFSELCDTAAEYNAVVGIEGAAGHVLYDVKTLKKAVDEIAKDNIKIIFDVYNFLDETNSKNYLDILDEGLETFGKQIHCFHMKDCIIEDNTKPIQCPVGKGHFDYQTILRKIREHNENAILILEGTTGEDIKPSADFLRKTWEQL